MAKGKVNSEVPVCAAEVRGILLKVKESEKELNFRSQKTLDCLEAAGLLSPENAQKLLKKLHGLAIPRLRELHMHKIVDVMPATAKDVKTVLQSYAITVTNENMQKIADTVAESIE